MSEKIVLSKPTEFELRGGVCIKVYPASLETLSQLDPKLKSLEGVSEQTDLNAQVKAFVEVVYDLIKEDNEGITKESLKKALTVEACIQIIKTSMGSLGNFAV